MDETLISVRVQPRASRNAVQGFEGETLRVSVTAPPVGGKANGAVVALLAQVLDLPKSALTLRGSTSRCKVLLVRGLSREELQRRLTLTGR